VVSPRLAGLGTSQALSREMAQADAVSTLVSREGGIERVEDSE
jgi:hypothetical protein